MKKNRFETKHLEKRIKEIEVEKESVLEHIGVLYDRYLYLYKVQNLYVERAWLLVRMEVENDNHRRR